jgi:ubiquinone/menaquinone biosynthesis C-methylase UbiE
MKETTPFAPQTHSRPGWYKRLFASMLANSDTRFNSVIAGHKRQLLGPLHGRILEIGPGAGSNLAYFSPDISWIGIEPNPAMFPYLQAEARRFGLSIEIHEGNAELLPVPDESMDAIVSTWVLCSVSNPSRTLQEVLRVLKPGGSFVFLEHVAAPSHTLLRNMQNLIRPVWQMVGDGCHPNRETWTVIEQAGFQRVQLEHFQLDVPIIGTQITGIAVK